MRISWHGCAIRPWAFLVSVVGGTMTLAVLGCSGAPPPVPPAKYKPEEMAAAAMAQYDKNHDGKLDEKELEACPALRKLLANLDKEDMPYLTEKDIADRLEQFEKSKVGLMGTRCRVTNGGSPMPGVTVTFIPEAFMGEGIKPATGVSDDFGMVEMAVAGEDVPGVSLGYYRVEASLKNESEKELIKPRFNTETILGQEVQNRRPDVLHIELGE